MSIDNTRHLKWTVIVVTAPDQESAYAYEFGLYTEMSTNSDIKVCSVLLQFFGKGSVTD